MHTSRFSAFHQIGWLKHKKRGSKIEASHPYWAIERSGCSSAEPYPLSRITNVNILFFPSAIFGQLNTAF